ncbi:MAG: hypothetical protein AB8G11_02345 [Saprospiraceae bacterium]
MKSVRLSAHVNDDGELKLGTFEKQVIKGFSGNAIYLNVEEKLKKPSLSQRGYYMGFVLPVWRLLLINEDIENRKFTIKQLHKIAIKKFMPAVEKMVDIENAVYELEDPSTKEGRASMVMYAILTESVIRMIAELYGVVIPDASKENKVKPKDFVNNYNYG